MSEELERFFVYRRIQLVPSITMTLIVEMVIIFAFIVQSISCRDDLSTKG